MKKLLSGLSLFLSFACAAQTFPVNNLIVEGTASFSGASTFTLSPTGPTPTSGDSSTKLATTAFVSSSFSPLVSPVFTGVPIAPTASVGTNTGQLATTAFVAQHAPCYSILDNGGNSGGSADNTAALAATAALSAGGQACVYFPPGIYNFSSASLYTLPSSVASLTIMGAGAEVTKLVWPSGGGLEIRYVSSTNAVHISGLSFLTGTAGTGTGLYLHQTNASIPNPANTSLTDLTNLVFRGSDGYSVTNYWATAISELGVSNTGVYGVSISGAATAAGIGINLLGTASLPSVQWNISNSNFNQLSNGLVYGTQVQGVTVNQSNFVSSTGSGIVVPTGETNLDQLTVVGSQFNTGGSAGISVNTGVANVQITSNLFIVPGATSGIDLEGEGITSITGNTFQSSGSSGANNGIVINTTANSWPTTIVSNSLQGLRGSAILLKSPSSFVYVGLNGYQGNGTNISNSGANNVIVGQVLSNSTLNTSLSSGVTNNATSIVLPAGQWDVECSAQFNPAGGTTVTGLEVGVSSTSAAFGSTGSLQQLQLIFATGATQNIISPVVRIGLASASTLYCPANAAFGASTMTVNGFVRAVALNPQ